MSNQNDLTAIVDVRGVVARPWAGFPPVAESDPVVGVPADITLSPRASPTPGPNFDQNTPDRSVGVCGAASISRKEAGTRMVADPPLNTLDPMRADPVRATFVRAPAELWTLSRALEFRLLWAATELSQVEVAAHFNRTPRQLRRLRSHFGLADRPTLDRLGRAARRRLHEEERLAEGALSEAAQALLRVAQARRKVDDRARDAARVARLRRK